MYGLVCERWGVDPAVGFEDEVLAYNLRLALLLSMNEPDEPEDDHRTQIERTKAAGEAIRRDMRGEHR